MEDQKTKDPEKQHILEPRSSITLFDVFHLVLTLLIAIKSAVIVERVFGGLLAVVAFMITTVIAFYAVGYAIAAFVLFLYRRYSPQSRIGYEAACYVLSHRK